MVFKSIWIQVILCILSAGGLVGCESIRYYNHLISGQMTILNKKKPIEQVLVEPQVPTNLKKQLRLVLEIREFAKNDLYLPIDDHYLSFVDLDRPFAVWNVYATPEFSLTPKTWCYPVVGCAFYRGYFSEEKAHVFAEKLQHQGFDVFVGGVTAYSTLGWFDDPVLNTFIYRNDIKLAALIFHEMAHQLLYVKNDTTFNESFATAVSQEGLRRWLPTKNMGAFSDYQTDYQRHQEFIQLVMKYRKKLELLFSKDLSPSNMRHAKLLVYNELRDEYNQLKAQWNGYSGYDRWFSHTLNNAQLVSVATYYDLVPAFIKLLQDNGNDLKLFYTTCQKLAKKSEKERRVYLERH